MRPLDCYGILDQVLHYYAAQRSLWLAVVLVALQQVQLFFYYHGDVE